MRRFCNNWDSLIIKDSALGMSLVRFTIHLCINWNQIQKLHKIDGLVGLECSVLPVAVVHGEGVLEL